MSSAATILLASCYIKWEKNMKFRKAWKEFSITFYRREIILFCVNKEFFFNENNTIWFSSIEPQQYRVYLYNYVYMFDVCILHVYIIYTSYIICTDLERLSRSCLQSALRYSRVQHRVLPTLADINC